MMDHEPELNAEVSSPELVESVMEPLYRTRPDGATDPIGEVGWYLQREREARAEDLEQIGVQIGVHPYHLDAIELGDMTRMPERGEALAMIAAYASYLGFDPDVLIVHYAAFLPQAEIVAPVEQYQDVLSSHQPEAVARPLSSAKILGMGHMASQMKFPKLPALALSRTGSANARSGAVMGSVLAAMLLVSGASYMFYPSATAINPAQIAEAAEADMGAPVEAGEAQIAETDSALPDTASGDVGPDVETAANVQPPADNPEASGAFADDAMGNFIQQTVASTDAAPAVTKQAKANAANAAKTMGATGATGPATPGQARIFGAENESSRLTLRAKAPVWVRIEDKSGAVLMTQMLMKNDTYRVPDRADLVVIARDGGLISYEVDGKSQGVLGTPGEVLVGRPLSLKDLGAGKNG